MTEEGSGLGKRAFIHCSGGVIPHLPTITIVRYGSLHWQTTPPIFANDVWRMCRAPQTYPFVAPECLKRHHSFTDKMSVDNRPGIGAFGSTQMVVRRQKSDASLNSGTEVTVGGRSAQNGALISAVPHPRI